MQKGKAGTLLAGSLGGTAGRGYCTGRAWELLQTQLGGQPSQHARERPGFLQNTRTLVFLNGNSERKNKNLMSTAGTHMQKETISSRARPLFGFQLHNCGHHLWTQTSGIYRKILREPGGVLKHAAYFSWAFHFPEYGKKRANSKALLTTLKSQLSACLPKVFFEPKIF